MHGACGAGPSSTASMHILGVAISVFAVCLEGLTILRSVSCKLFRLFPLFYSYLVYAFSGTLVMYVIYWRRPLEYRSAFWIYYLVSMLVEFTVLVEISDQIFRSLPALRNLGRALTFLISIGLAIIYILPSIVSSTRRSRALLEFSLRASVTKAIILGVLFYVSQHYGSKLGRNVGGLMLGFSIYVGTNVAIWSSAKAFGSVLFGRLLWFMEPLAFTLCLLVWTVSLWELAPATGIGDVAAVGGTDSQAVALELTRFNNELSKLIHR